MRTIFLQLKFGNESLIWDDVRLYLFLCLDTPIWIDAILPTHETVEVEEKMALFPSGMICYESFFSLCMLLIIIAFREHWKLQLGNEMPFQWAIECAGAKT